MKSTALLYRGATAFLLGCAAADPVLAQDSAPGPAQCIALAGLQEFPVFPTQITLTQFLEDGAASANGVPLPAHCRVQGIMEERTGVRGIVYGTRFEVRLPVDWNGRFMYQGGGGTQGNLSNATGSAGTLSPTLARGFAVASDNGGHTNSQLTPDPNGVIITGNMFYDDPQAVLDWSYRSAALTARTAKYLIKSFYEKPARRSYFVGCSTSGRQAMGMAQLFAKHFDGIVAGDPFFVPPHISLSETWTIQQIKSISQTDANGNTLYYTSIPDPDKALFTRAILEACDGLDGLVDGVIDNHAACTFDPATFVFAASGEPLQCAGEKNASCLSPAQVDVIRKMADGPRTSWGEPIVAPNGWPVTGYPYDGGWMEPSGIPARNIGTPTQRPGNLTLGTAQLPLFWFTVPDASYDPVQFNWGDTDMSLVVNAAPGVRDQFDLTEFRDHGGKLIFYHGMSDSGPPWTYTAYYYDRITKRGQGKSPLEDLARLYLIPNMGHCSGGPATDRFDFLTPLMQWVEKGVAPDAIVATGVNFRTPPTTRSRPLCPYPKTLRYSGSGDLADAPSYRCVE